MTWLKAVGYSDAAKLRVFETRDIVKRLGAIAPNRVFINNYPIANPIAIFNSSFVLKDSQVAEVYARIIIGYYLYVSAIVRMEIPVSDILEGAININHYSSEIVAYPSTKYDIWGCEDPRVYFIGDKLYMTYAGRSIHYLKKPRAIESVLPITAVSNNGRSWTKLYVHVFSGSIREKVVHDKDAFILNVGSDSYLFHRPELLDDTYHLLVSRVDMPRECSSIPCRVAPTESYEVMPPAAFEIKTGWAYPVMVRGRRAILLVHGVDKELQAYRVFAVEVELGREVVVTAVTPFYIMEPRAPYELYGDRPLTVFPCGAHLIDDKLVISYGAADFMIGFGATDFAEFMSMLDKGRLY